MGEQVVVAAEDARYSADPVVYMRDFLMREQQKWKDADEGFRVRINVGNPNEYQQQ